MPTNRTSNDIDFVPLTQYPIPLTRKAKERPPEPWPLPAFEPLQIKDYDNHGTPNLPPYLDPHDALGIFKLFFTDEIMDKLVEWTNKYAALHPAKEEARQLHRPRLWLPTCREELYAYFGVLIHMGITIESAIEDYWGICDPDGASHLPKNYISLVRFQ